jgi:TM2 domain-containing membrane protein YozV
MFLLGKHAIFGHDPPISLRSTTAVRRPTLAIAQARFLLLGAFGAHNFYAGYYKKAGIQLGITLLTLGFGSPMSWLWAVIDICTIDRDVRGVQFES